ncbi:Lrp/AsnC family transcriptional regulator [Mumia sp. ZJ1417]|nr:Lrp/AsnC family transcriptional regulator [Mumia sp. ZJ1417]
MDDLDAQIVRLFLDEPKIGVLEASRRLGVARATVQSRLDRLAERGVIASWSPTVSPAALGFPVTAFLTLEVVQSAGRPPAADHLASIPEVLEACTITGAGDLWCRVVARSNADLQRVLDAVVSEPSIVRVATVIALQTELAPRVAPLLDATAALDTAVPPTS